MKIGIHNTKVAFGKRWRIFCEEKGVPCKEVDCYRSDISSQLSDCDALMWHFHQGNPKDILFAKQLLYSFETAGKRVFPNFYTMWHFDDKVGQKYLLEAINAPLVTSWVFYDKHDAEKWAENTSYPVVFKLRGGAGSVNVSLVATKERALKLIRKAFGNGYSQYLAWQNLNERVRKYRLGKTDMLDVFKGVIRLALPPKHALVAGKERGYVYFQKFIPDNDYDIRVIVIGNKAFAIKRMVRQNDFRASGSGHILYEKKHFDQDTIRLAFSLAEKLKSQCSAFDFVYENGSPLVVEVSYGFVPEGYDPCPGYWDKNMAWHEGRFNPYGWMVENLIKAASA